MGRVQRLGTLLLIVLVSGAFVGLSPAAAQTSKEARGTVTAVTDSSLKVKVGAQEMTFAVDSKTAVLARGAGRATRDAQATGAPGIKIGDAIKVGGAVIVQYTESGGRNTATEVRAVSDAGGGGGSVSTPAPPSKSVTGKVKSATADSLVVTADNKDMTFAVTPETKVEARGAGTATQAAGGRIAFNTLVGTGDTVAVTYQEAGATMRATEVRITIKAR
jgi:Domain of unknown function (DUF5666)